MNKIDNNIGWFTLFCVVSGFIVYFPTDFFVSWDLSTYLVYAQNFLQGEGLTDPAGKAMTYRPVFPLMLAVIISLCEKSILAIALFETLWSVLFLTGLFFLAWRLFCKTTGVVVVILFSMSPDMGFWLPRHLDPVWPALLFWGLVVLLRPQAEKDKSVSEVTGPLIAAILVGLAFFVKEMAIFAFLLPLLFQVFKLLPGGWKRVCLFYLFLAGILVVGGYCFQFVNPHTTGDVSGSVGHTAILKNIMQSPDLMGVLRLGFFLLKGVWFYFVPVHYGASIYQYISLLPFIGLAALWCLWRAIQGERSNQILLLLILVFLPFASWCGQFNLRVSQNLFLIGCLYLLLSAALVNGKEFFQHWTNKSLLPGIILCFFVAVLVAYQFSFSKKGMKWLLTRPIVAQVYKGKPFFVYTFRGQGLGDWIKKNTKVGETVMVSRIAYQHGAKWVVGSRNRIEQVPFNQAGKGIMWPYYEVATPDKGPYHLTSVIPEHPIRKYPLFMLLSNHQLIKTLQREQIRYIATSPKGVADNLTPWLEQHAGVEKIAEDKKLLGDNYEVICIYRVKEQFSSYQPPAPGLFLDKDILDYFHKLESSEPEVVQWYRQHILQELLGMTNGDIHRFQKGIKSGKSWVVQ